MTTLDDAWAWYQATSSGAQVVARLAKYWDLMPWEGGEEWIRALARDNLFRHLEAGQLAKDAEQIENGLEDLAILMLFSVFEANVRDLVESDVRPEIEALKHPALRKAGEDVLQAVTEGSFYRVLEPFKSAATNDLIEQVNQVRRYRNWVAHGCRADKKPDALVKPREAYKRLKTFLDLLQPAPSQRRDLSEGMD